MKKTILLLLAMCFAFAMPAQAEDVEGLSPVASYGAQGDTAVAEITDNKVASERCTMQQLEAAVLTTNSSAAFADKESAQTAGYAKGYGVTHEVGWRRSINA